MMGWTYFSHIIAHMKFMEGNLHKYHHDPEKSSKIGFRILEFFLDIMIFGGAIIIPINYGIEFAFGSAFRFFNYYGILFWSLLYSTYHLDWHFIKADNPHSHHHKNDKTNYGPDILDILFETKMDEDIIENMNYAIINIVLVFGLFVIFRKFFLPYYINGENSQNDSKTI